ncbi:acetylcholine receptor subunit beta-like [Gigantopelta aegis]|uniref:acetylcholine receptor subunit beta-like n=1 Tax=Gigantopelta aegis TaxID=1735272 RepID=UPI001B88AA57|nr:acetylcholine receptor subunit beta-like [Gigantopelta aegis]
MDALHLLGTLILAWHWSSNPIQGHEKPDDVLHEIDNESHLYFHILDTHNYVRHVRPAAGINDTLVVTVDVTLTGVQGLDESTQELSSTVLLVAFWNDPRLKWDPAEYGGLQSVMFPSSEMWTPDLRLLHTQYGNFEHILKEPARVMYDGSVAWASHLKISSHCPVDISDFPFDAHVCKVLLAAGSYTSQQIHLQFLNSGRHQDDDGSGRTTTVCSVWDLVSKNIDGHVGRILHPEIFEYIAISVGLQRKSNFYHCVVTGPAVLVGLLVPVVFLLPAETTGKTSLGVCILLTLSVCLKMFVDVLGTNRSSAPRIAIFYVTTMALTSISVIMAAVVTSTARRGHRKRIPDWLNAVFLGRCGLRRWLCMESYSHIIQSSPFAAMKNTADFHEHDSDVSALKDGDGDLKEVSKNLRMLVGKYSAEEALRYTDNEWHEIALVTDRLLFVVFVILFMITTLALLS